MEHFIAFNFFLFRFTTEMLTEWGKKKSDLKRLIKEHLDPVQKLRDCQKVHKLHIFQSFAGVPHGSVVKCLTHNPGVLGSSCIRSSGFFTGVSEEKTLQTPSLVLNPFPHNDTFQCV